MSNEIQSIDDQILVSATFGAIATTSTEVAAARFLLLISDLELTRKRVHRLNLHRTDRSQPPASLTDMPSLRMILAAIRQASLVDEIQQGNISLPALADVADCPQALWIAACTLQELLEDEPEELSVFPNNCHENIQQWLLPHSVTQETTPVARTETTTADRRPETDSLWHPFLWLLIWKQQFSDSQWQKLSAHARPAMDSLGKLNTQPDIRTLLVTAHDTLDKAGLSVSALTDDPADVWPRFRFDLAFHRVFQYPQQNESDLQSQIRMFCSQLQVQSVSDLWLQSTELKIADVDGRSVERHLQTLVDRLQQEEHRIQLMVSNSGSMIRN
jgi:hypothetical protein